MHDKQVENGKSEFIELESITSDKFPIICRTCLGSENIQPIFNMLYKSIPIQDLLFISASIQVEQDDNLPQNICLECLVSLTGSFCFKQKCIQSDAILKNIQLRSVEITASNSDSPGHFIIIKHETVNNNDKFERSSIKSEGLNFQESSSLLCLQNNDNESASDSLIKYSGNELLIQENGAEFSDDPNYSLLENNLQNSENSLFPESMPQSSVTKTVEMNQEKQKKHSTEKQWVCKECSKVYNRKDSLARHMRTHTYLCEICGKDLIYSLTLHMRTHTKEKPYTCEICSKSFSCRNNLGRHVRIHTGERPHVCDFCGKGFTRAKTLDDHINIHTGEKSNECEFCGKSYSCKRSLMIHRCVLAKENQRPKIQRHNKSNHGPLDFHCNLCKKSFFTRGALLSHLKIHGEKKFSCNHCGIRFSINAQLQSHLRVHTGVKPFTCTICNKSYAHIGSLRTHELIHNGQRPFNCEICNKTFTQRSHLKYHIRLHTGEKPYKCSFCNKAFAMKGNLTVHVRTHTGETPYVCDVCGRGFYDASSMKKHINRHEVKLEQEYP